MILGIGLRSIRWRWLKGEGARFFLGLVCSSFLSVLVDLKGVFVLKASYFLLLV